MSDGKIIQENGENIMPITHETCVLDDEEIQLQKQLEMYHY